MMNNDNTDLTPVVPEGGPVLAFDFPAFSVGVAEYAEGPTGCTVFRFPAPVKTAVDLRGGSIGSIGNREWNHAICLAGGSSYGLAAATGVAAELLARNGYATEPETIAAVSGAIIYDFRARENAIIADAALGRAAVRAARPNWFPLGPRGAGCSAMCGRGPEQTGREHSGQGGAFRRIGPTKIAAFTVVNALGAICDRQGRVIRGHRDPQTGEHRHYHEELDRIRRRGAGGPPEATGGNTTLTVVITNQRLDRRQLTQFARQVHSSMARAIQPFHTIYDGDVFYGVTTDEIDNPDLDEVALGVEASEAVWDAILRLVEVMQDGG